MTDPKTLQEIAEKARIFARAHFDDDIEPSCETLLDHHERLTTDRKLVTRLRPRYIASLAFFEGYAKAIEDLSAKAPEQADIGIVKPPPPPPPPVAPIPFEFPTENEIEAAWYEKMWRENKKGDFGYKLASGVVELFRKRLGDPIADLQSKRSRIEELEKRIETDTAHYAYMAEQRQNVLNDLAKELTEANEKLSEKNIDLGSKRARIRELEKQLEQTEAERIAMKEDRDRALAGVRAWEARTGETQPRIVEAKLNAPMPTDKEIVDFMVRHIYTDVNGPIEAERSISKLEGDADSLRRTVRHWSGSLAEACAIKLALMHFMKHSIDDAPANEVQKNEREQHEQTTTVFDPGIPSTGSEERTALIFLDNEERKYWDCMSLMLARKGDASPQSIASAADEMVEERRKRMCKGKMMASDPIEVAKEVHGRMLKLGHGCTWSKRDGRIYVSVWDGPTLLSALNIDESIANGQTSKEMVDLLLAHPPKRDEHDSGVTDELLSEAAGYANEIFNEPQSDKDLRDARHAIELRQFGQWSSTVRDYVNGALRKSCKA